MNIEDRLQDKVDWADAADSNNKMVEVDLLREAIAELRILRASSFSADEVGVLVDLLQDVDQAIDANGEPWLYSCKRGENEWTADRDKALSAIQERLEKAG